MVDARGWRGGKGIYFSMNIEFYFYRMKKFERSVIIAVYKVNITVHGFEIVKMINFMLVILTIKNSLSQSVNAC